MKNLKLITERFNNLLNSKLGDVKPLVNEQAEESSTHRYDKGEQSPGIEKFLTNPNDDSISNGLLNELRNDPYGKGKIVIIFNGEKFKEPGAFMYKIQTDFQGGKCYQITSYEYNNRILLNTQIKITANGVECKKQKPTPTQGPGPKLNPVPPTPNKVECKHTISNPFERGEFSGGSIKGFQEYCSKYELWYKELSDGSKVPCTSKDIDGKWGCCSQTCYNNRKKRKPIVST